MNIVKIKMAGRKVASRDPYYYTHRIINTKTTTQHCVSASAAACGIQLFTVPPRCWLWCLAHLLHFCRYQPLAYFSTARSDEGITPQVSRASFMHLPPRTCPVRSISGDLRSSDPEVAAGRPASCVLFRVWAWSFFPLDLPVTEACSVVLATCDTRQNQRLRASGNNGSRRLKTPPSFPPTALGGWPLPRLRLRSRSRSPAPRYPLGMPLGFDSSMPARPARNNLSSSGIKRSFCARRACHCAKAIQGPLAFDLLLMIGQQHEGDDAGQTAHVLTSLHTRSQAVGARC